MEEFLRKLINRMSPYTKNIVSGKYGLKFLIKLIISFTLIMYVLSKVNINQIVNQWREVNWLQLIFTITAIQIICVILRTLRLSVILNSVDIKLSLLWLGLIQLKGIFLRTFLPGGIASDIYRTYVIAKEAEHGAKSILSILIERVYGIASMLFMSTISLFCGLYWFGHPVFKSLTPPVLFVAGAFLIVGVIIAVSIRIGIIDKIQVSFKLWIKFQEFVKQIPIFFFKSSNILKMFTLSILLQIVIVSWYFTVSRSLDFNLSFLVLMATIPIVELLLMLPISIGGIGVREGVFIFLFTPFGLTVEDSVSFGLLGFTVATITRILSGSAFLFQVDPKDNINRKEILKYERR